MYEVTRVPDKFKLLDNFTGVLTFSLFRDGGDSWSFTTEAVVSSLSDCWLAAGESDVSIFSAETSSVLMIVSSSSLPEVVCGEICSELLLASTDAFSPYNLKL